MALKNKRHFHLNRYVLPFFGRRKSDIVKTMFWVMMLAVGMGFMACDLMVNKHNDIEEARITTQPPSEETPVPITSITLTGNKPYPITEKSNKGGGELIPDTSPPPEPVRVTGKYTDAAWKAFMDDWKKTKGVPWDEAHAKQEEEGKFTMNLTATILPANTTEEAIWTVSAENFIEELIPGEPVVGASNITVEAPVRSKLDGDVGGYVTVTVSAPSGISDTFDVWIYGVIQNFE
jgi:hypothetical protein